jgi:SAM-dependent methyltransferase
VREGIPVLLTDVSVSSHDEIGGRHIGHAPDDRHKVEQAAHFDDAVAEAFEISRPHGTPRLYQFFMAEKFRRAIGPIRSNLDGVVALTVCGGSGMDAEFLARRGARVIASDLSVGAALRTRERACRYSLDITPIVADIELLPFADASVDLVLVHDGLHHLEDPDRGLAEMARVARSWVSISEPARAAATAIAIKAGVSLEREEAGNRVARVDPAVVIGTLRDAGFDSVVATRYAMYYRHEPGRIFGLLSRRGIFPLVRTGWWLVNKMVGRFGNKVAIVAKRTHPVRPDDADDRVHNLGGSR